MSKPAPEDVYQFVCQKSKPFVTTQDASEEFDGVTSKTVRDRLNTLVDRGRLNVRQVGAQAKVWWPADYDHSDESISRSRPESESQ